MAILETSLLGCHRRMKNQIRNYRNLGGSGGVYTRIVKLDWDHSKGEERFSSFAPAKVLIPYPPPPPHLRGIYGSKNNQCGSIKGTLFKDAV